MLPRRYSNTKLRSKDKMGAEKTSFCVVKYIFFAFNVFIWLMGCGVLALGIWLQFNRGPFVSMLPAYSFLSASALCITAGAIILIVGFLGCCGAFLENQCMLIGYFVMVLLIFALEITAGTLGFVKKAEVQMMIKKELLASIRHDYTPVMQNPNTEGWMEVIDSLQTDLQCCGVDNFTDWYRIKAWPDAMRVPDSCCLHPVEFCGKLDKSFWFERGCLGEIEYWFVRNMYILGVVGITVGVIQILAMVASVVLFCYLRSKKFML
ncbi:tetraspanin-4-like isoform X2 [Haliotis rufescens]|uniref:tetraspanin-4-like isoform X2 n=1 Tax=Haliotis rufescens TaxID=6454 RepID=UPI001EAFC9E0|nr:tetraspanin-4-like isoform X2 [Haliotis rufescens]